MLYDILLDIGGTGIKGGFCSVDNNIISDFTSFVSCSEKDKDVIIRHFCSICGQIWDRIDGDDKKIRDIRMAFPGPFDYKNGISKVKGLAKYESLLDVSIPNEMIRLSTDENYCFIPEEDYHYKFVNDVEAYALGTMKKRKLLQGYRVIYLCIGTGAGSAYSVDGKILLDSSQGIPENGWVYPIPYRDSVIDEYISARGISRLTQKYCNKSISPLELSKMVKNGDECAAKAYREFGEDMNSAIFPLLKEFGADTFVIGGNISLSSDMFISPIEESCTEYGIDIIIESDTSKLIMMGLTTI